MNLQPYVTAVEDDLARATALADEHTQDIAGRLSTAIEPALWLALVQALSDAAATITGQLEEAVVTVRMEGREPVLDVQPVPPVAAATPATTPLAVHGTEAEDGTEGVEDDGAAARVTVRLADSLKRRAETRASEAEQSLNTWIVQAIRHASEGAPCPDGLERPHRVGTPPHPDPPPHPGTPHHSSRRISGWA